EAFGEKVEALQDGQAGPDEGDELLVEDQELLDVELLPPAEKASGRDRGGAGSRLDRIDEEALRGIPLAKLLFGGGGSHLLVDLPAAVGVFEDEIRHLLLSRLDDLRPFGDLELK